VPPTVGQTQKIAVISDTHLGSKYCLREQLKDFVLYAYSRGIREILHPGDILDGCYKHGLWEVSHSGLEAQMDDLLQTLPALPGLTYHAITGNHDFTFTEANGVDVGRALTNRFREAGRTDISFYGDRGAFVKVRGVTINMWHPKKGCAYAVSYGLQKRIETYGSGEKPGILLTGHWHRYCHIFERGVHGLACPTFQGGGSAFGKSIGGSPAIGGLLLSWDLTEHGTIRNLSHTYRAYFEREAPQPISAP
jgi:predicted phosphodiesterase